MENQDKVQNDGSKKVDSKTICILVLIGVILVGVIAEHLIQRVFHSSH
jgi:hypothetical protein